MSQQPFKVILNSEDLGSQQGILALSAYMKEIIRPMIPSELKKDFKDYALRQKWIAEILKGKKGAELTAFLNGHSEKVIVVSAGAIIDNYPNTEWVGFPKGCATFHFGNFKGGIRVFLNLERYGTFLTDLEITFLQANIKPLYVNLNVLTGEARVHIKEGALEASVAAGKTFIVEVPLECTNVELRNAKLGGQEGLVYRTALACLNAWCDMKTFLNIPNTLDYSYQFKIYREWLNYTLSQPYREKYEPREIQAFIQGWLAKHPGFWRSNLKVTLHRRFYYTSIQKLEIVLRQTYAQNIARVLLKCGIPSPEMRSEIIHKLTPLSFKEAPPGFFRSMSSLYLEESITGWDFVFDSADDPFLTLLVPRFGIVKENGTYGFGKFFTDLNRADIKRPLVKTVTIFQRLVEERSDYAMHLEIDTRCLSSAQPDFLRWASKNKPDNLYWQPVGGIPRVTFNKLQEVQRQADEADRRKEIWDEDESSGLHEIVGEDASSEDFPLHWTQLMERVGKKVPDLGIDYFNSPRDYAAQDERERLENEKKELMDSINIIGDSSETAADEDTDIDNSPETEG